MSFQDTEIHDLVAAYALDAVDDDERMAFERHLETCERCRNELAGLRDTAASLAYAAGPVAPAPGAARADPRRRRAQSGPTSSRCRPRRSRTAVVLGTATAIAAGIAIALGIWNISLHNSLDDEQAQLAATNKALIVACGDAEAPLRHERAGASGQLVVASSGKAALVYLQPAEGARREDLPGVGAHGDSPTPAGEFDPDSGCVAVPLDASVPADTGVAVTVEPDGGSTQPTTGPILHSMPA